MRRCLRAGRLKIPLTGRSLTKVSPLAPSIRYYEASAVWQRTRAIPRNGQHPNLDGPHPRFAPSLRDLEINFGTQLEPQCTSNRQFS